LTVPPGDHPHGARGPSFVALWVIVTGLWIVATILRMQRVWVPGVGWPAVLGNVYTWIELFLPQWMFAIILLAVERLAMPHGRS
jgi:hypothetical protein